MDVDGELVIFQVGKLAAEELCVEMIAKEERMCTFELWVKGCEINHTKVYRLEGEGDTAVYKTQSDYKYKHNRYKTSPIYHVWIRGVCVVVIQDYEKAIEIYYKRLKAVERKEKADGRKE